jgi:Thiamine monophosphate synthase
MLTSSTRILQDDLPAAEARALLGPRRILGVSVKTPEQAVAAAAAGADYLGAGAGGEGLGDWSLTLGQIFGLNGRVTTTCGH